MAKFGDGRDLVKCSFCGKSQRMIARFIDGPNVRICNECVDLCVQILTEEGVPTYGEKTTHVPHDPRSEGSWSIEVQAHTDQPAVRDRLVKDIQSWCRDALNVQWRVRDVLTQEEGAEHQGRHGRSAGGSFGGSAGSGGRMKREW